MNCFLKYYFCFFLVRWEKGPSEDWSMCWNNACVDTNELVNDFHFFLTNVQILKDSGTVVCVCLSQHMLLKEGIVSLVLK